MLKKSDNLKIIYQNNNIIKLETTSITSKMLLAIGYIKKNEESVSIEYKVKYHNIEGEFNIPKKNQNYLEKDVIEIKESGNLIYNLQDIPYIAEKLIITIVFESNNTLTEDKIGNLYLNLLTMKG